MRDLKVILQEKANELANQHAKIIEIEIEKVLKKFNISSDQLIIKLFQSNKVEIDIKGAHFEINNEFIIRE